MRSRTRSSVFNRRSSAARSAASTIAATFAEAIEISLSGRDVPSDESSSSSSVLCSGSSGRSAIGEMVCATARAPARTASAAGDLDAEHRRLDVLGPDVVALLVAEVAQRLVQRVAELLLGDLGGRAPGLAPDQGVDELVVVVVADGDAHLEPQRLPAAVGQPARAGVALQAL